MVSKIVRDALFHQPSTSRVDSRMMAFGNASASSGQNAEAGQSTADA